MALAAELQLQADVVEKDYALGWLLAGIATHPVIEGQHKPACIAEMLARRYA